MRILPMSRHSTVIINVCIKISIRTAEWYTVTLCNRIPFM